MIASCPSSRLLAVAVVMISAAGPASAQTFDPLNAILEGAGLVSPNKPSIEYRDRAPLVLPKDRTKLPTPEESASANEAWPKDPDVVAAEKAAEEEKVPAGETETYRRNMTDNKLSPAEMERQYKAYRGQNGDAVADSGPDTVVDPDRVRPVNPDELIGKHHNWPDKPKAGEEPVRTRLTDPPAGYRVPSPNAATTTTATETKKKSSWWPF